MPEAGLYGQGPAPLTFTVLYSRTHFCINLKTFESKSLIESKPFRASNYSRVMPKDGPPGGILRAGASRIPPGGVVKSFGGYLFGLSVVGVALPDLRAKRWPRTSSAPSRAAPLPAARKYW